jgi:NAD+ kinase
LRERGLHPILVAGGEAKSEPVPKDLSLVVTFGGDGTILRAAQWLAGDAAPVVGVQMGRLGFLAELMPADVPTGLMAYLDGECWLDRRQMLATRVVSTGNDGAGQHELLALNDVVVGRGASLRTVTVDVSVEGLLLRRFRCDGLIVATPTGSTAYSFAAGGPVLAPDAAEVVVTPICPHISALRSLVLPSDVTIRLQVWTSEPAVMTIDGQVDLPLADGQIVETRVSGAVTTFARSGTRAELYRRIVAKLA